MFPSGVQGPLPDHGHVAPSLFEAGNFSHKEPPPPTHTPLGISLTRGSLVPLKSSSNQVRPLEDNLPFNKGN